QREHRARREHPVTEEVERQHGLSGEALGNEERDVQDESPNERADYLCGTPVIGLVATPGQSQQQADGGSRGQGSAEKVDAPHGSPTAVATAAQRDVGGQVDEQRSQRNDAYGQVDVEHPAPARGVGNQVSE